MENLQTFLEYARHFEQTLVDDDWRRLEPYLADDAVYEVKAPSFGCRLVGRPAIFAGIKKSLDGFDRKFAGREIAVTDGPHVEGDDIRMGWQVTYKKDGLTPFVLKGRSAVCFRGGRIAHLTDSYEPAVGEEFAAWQRRNGIELDMSYT